MQTHPEGRRHEDTGSRRPSTAKESGPADPRSQTSSPQDCGRINFGRLSRPAFGASLGKLRDANVGAPTNIGGPQAAAVVVSQPLGTRPPEVKGRAGQGAPQQAEGRAS